jgi:energy-coupling factor transporter ATP-binding protein EcfA2
MVLLTLQDVSKAFGMNRILSGVNLTLKEGSRMGLVGVNGSGKSTLMKIIVGELAPDSGTISLVKGTQVGLLTQQADIDSELNVWDELAREIPALSALSTLHFDNWADTRAFAESALTGDVTGVHAFYHANIFQAVYATNLLMRSCDVLVTKPSELAFYPVPKLFIRRIGGHEQWGAVHSAEIGDGTLECRDIPHTLQMMELFLTDGVTLRDMCDNIVRNKSMGIYDGAYKVVQTAMGLKNQNK